VVREASLGISVKAGPLFYNNSLMIQNNILSKRDQKVASYFDINQTYTNTNNVDIINLLIGE
jgi:hypothetical protein